MEDWKSQLDHTRQMIDKVTPFSPNATHSQTHLAQSIRPKSPLQSARPKSPASGRRSSEPTIKGISASQYGSKRGERMLERSIEGKNARIRQLEDIVIDSCDVQTIAILNQQIETLIAAQKVHEQELLAARCALQECEAENRSLNSKFECNRAELDAFKTESIQDKLLIQTLRNALVEAESEIESLSSSKSIVHPDITSHQLPFEQSVPKKNLKRSSIHSTPNNQSVSNSSQQIMHDFYVNDVLAHPPRPLTPPRIPNTLLTRTPPPSCSSPANIHVSFRQTQRSQHRSDFAPRERHVNSHAPEENTNPKNDESDEETLIHIPLSLSSSTTSSRRASSLHQKLMQSSIVQSRLSSSSHSIHRNSQFDKHLRNGSNEEIVEKKGNISQAHNRGFDSRLLSPHTNKQSLLSNNIQILNSRAQAAAPHHPLRPTPRSSLATPRSMSPPGKPSLMTRANGRAPSARYTSSSMSRLTSVSPSSSSSISNMDDAERRDMIKKQRHALMQKRRQQKQAASQQQTVLTASMSNFDTTYNPPSTSVSLSSITKVSEKHNPPNPKPNSSFLNFPSATLAKISDREPAAPPSSHLESDEDKTSQNDDDKLLASISRDALKNYRMNRISATSSIATSAVSSSANGVRTGTFPAPNISKSISKTESRPFANSSFAQSLPRATPLVRDATETSDDDDDILSAAWSRRARPNSSYTVVQPSSSNTSSAVISQKKTT